MRNLLTWMQVDRLLSIKRCNQKYVVFNKELLSGKNSHKGILIGSILLHWNIDNCMQIYLLDQLDVSFLCSADFILSGLVFLILDMFMVFLWKLMCQSQRYHYSVLIYWDDQWSLDRFSSWLEQMAGAFFSPEFFLSGHSTRTFAWPKTPPPGIPFTILIAPFLQFRRREGLGLSNFRNNIKKSFF